MVHTLQILLLSVFISLDYSSSIQKGNGLAGVKKTVIVKCKTLLCRNMDVCPIGAYGEVY